MDELRLELIALMDEAVPAHDLGYCISLSLPGHGFENCKTYDEIRELFEKQGINPYNL